MRRILVAVAIVVIAAVASLVATIGGALGPLFDGVRPLAEFYLFNVFNAHNATLTAMSPEAVTSIVWDYRGLDTLFETVVFYMAIIGCVALYRGIELIKDGPEVGLSRIVKTVTKILIVVNIAVAASIALHGHLTPGGGFQAGAAMAVAPNGNAGFVFRSASGNNAQYIEETALGVLSPPVPITSNPQGSIADIVFGANNEPRVVLSYDADGGSTFVQRTNNVWTTPMMIVTNIFEEKRAVITLTPNQKPAVLWYENGNGSNGELIDINTTGDSYTSADVTVPPFPVSPNDLRKPFGMIAGTDGKRRIVISGPGSGDDQIWFGTEDSAGAGTFTWEQVAASNLYADQIGFTLDDNNYAYISCEDKSAGDINAKCVLLENASGSWVKHTLGDIADLWNRSAIAVDVNGNVWVAHNAHTYDHFYLWSNRSGSWEEEQTITNKEVIETISGFDINNDNVMKISYVPYDGSTDIIYMYSTKFAIPEPVSIFYLSFIICYLLKFRKFKS